jgi:hypothetical protein
MSPESNGTAIAAAASGVVTWSDVMQRLMTGLVVGLTFFACTTAAQNPKTKTAVLVEAHGLPRCVGLDCPPWPMPVDVDACVQIAGVYYTGMYRPWGVPWATAGKRLMELVGLSVEVVISDTEIRVAGPHVNVRLVRMHHCRVFSSPSCNSA